MNSTVHENCENSQAWGSLLLKVEKEQKHTNSVWVVSTFSTCPAPDLEGPETWKRDPLLRRHHQRWPVGSSPPQQALSLQNHDGRPSR